jgi:uncharacterized membrane-anchored protein
MKSLPKINGAYWATLAMASTFGTNTGDFVSEYLHIGNMQGLPYLSAAIAAVFALERLTSWANPFFFWLVIILVRTAATNLGDAFHQYGIGFATSLPIMLATFAAAVWAYAKFSPRGAEDDNNIRVSPLYWLCMTLAGALGTIGGDFVSFSLGLMPVGTAITVGALAASLLYNGRFGLWLHPIYYWTALALIRTAGTGAGDTVGHINMPVVTGINGLIFFGSVFWFYISKRENRSTTLSPSLLPAE